MKLNRKRKRKRKSNETRRLSPPTTQFKEISSVAPISSSTSLLSTRSRSFSTGSGGGTSIGTFVGDKGAPSLLAFGELTFFGKDGTGGVSSGEDVDEGGGNLKFLSIVPLRCLLAAADNGDRLLVGDATSSSASDSSGTGAGFGDCDGCWLTKFDVSASAEASPFAGCRRGGGIEARFDGPVA